MTGPASSGRYPTVPNTKTVNIHDYKVETWNASFVAVNSYSCIKMVNGIYISAEVQTLNILTKGNEIPFLVVDRPGEIEFDSFISNLLNGDGIIFPHTSYSYAFVLRAHKDIPAAIYFVSLFIPFKIII